MGSTHSGSILPIFGNAPSCRGYFMQRLPKPAPIYPLARAGIYASMAGAHSPSWYSIFITCRVLATEPRGAPPKRGERGYPLWGMGGERDREERGAPRRLLFSIFYYILCLYQSGTSLFVAFCALAYYTLSAWR